MDTVEIHDLETSVSKAALLDQVSESVHYGQLCKLITKFVEKQKLDGLEILAEHLAFLILTFDIVKIFGVFLTIKKPNSAHFVKSTDISIYRCFENVHFLKNLCCSELEKYGFAIPDLDNYDSVKAENSFINSVNTLEKSISDAGKYYEEDFLFIKELKINALLGANNYERYAKQEILVDLTLHVNKKDRDLQVNCPLSYYPKKLLHYRRLVQNIIEYVEKGTGYLTLEALSLAIARVCIVDFGFEKVSVLIKKPCVLIFANCSAVKITRTREQLFKELGLELPSIQNYTNSSTQPNSLAKSHISYIAIGTNLGDRLKNIHNSLKKINESGTCSVVDTGFLYQSKPMYVEDQPLFLNTAIKIETSLQPNALLKELKRIEAEVGRDFGTIRNGHRVIDLDILLYDSIVMDTPELSIPHLNMHERHFQLQPLIDMDPYAVHGRLNSSVDMLSRDLVKIEGVVNDLVQVMPLSSSEVNGPKTLVPVHSHQKNTVIMGIVNATPDSFSDGGKFESFSEAVSHSMKLFSEGAEIVDIGGKSAMSVGADSVETAEELSRVIPVVAGIKSRSKELETKPIISVDTFVAEVAQAALEAGADIINDISGGDLDEEMFKVVAKYGCPYVLMHMRGNPKTMATLTDYKIKVQTDSNANLTSVDEVVLVVRYELSKKVREALQSGIPRFNIILDPGIDCSKNLEQNFEVLRRLPELTSEQLYAMSSNSALHMDMCLKLNSNYNRKRKDNAAFAQFHEQLFVSLLGFPVLVGSSRKGFIGQVTGKKVASDRVFGTAATVTSAIQGNASIVRVHDVDSMVDVAKVSDRIYRN
ncbi:Folic acid synthesis protein fol1 [Smittium culicis]|uniref:Folic acid synthesis protein fol1 n=1 Tax=Smittium culicis TaxID=133412 RepID=A0A1R1YFJ3_9FUNG|nr:Folic acid synthesis protein fol1 [Smittium culicis]